jgi:hypothetical protein
MQERRPRRPEPRPLIPASVERRARWVLDTIGGHELRLGPDLPYDASAWEQVGRGERPDGDELAEAFFHLARLEESGRRGTSTGGSRRRRPPLDPLTRRSSGSPEAWLEPPRWHGARVAVALTHDVDAQAVTRRAARRPARPRPGRRRARPREARALAAVPLHKLRRTDPNWRFEALLDAERERASTFFPLAGHNDRHDGAAPEVTSPRPRPWRRSRPGGEVGVHGATAARDRPRQGRASPPRAGADVRGRLPLPPCRPPREPAPPWASACSATRRSPGRTRFRAGSRSPSARGTSRPTALDWSRSSCGDGRHR